MTCYAPASSPSEHVGRIDCTGANGLFSPVQLLAIKEGICCCRPRSLCFTLSNEDTCTIIPSRTGRTFLGMPVCITHPWDASFSPLPQTVIHAWMESLGHCARCSWHRSYDNIFVLKVEGARGEPHEQNGGRNSTFKACLLIRDCLSASVLAKAFNSVQEHCVTSSDPRQPGSPHVH